MSPVLKSLKGCKPIQRITNHVKKLKQQALLKPVKLAVEPQSPQNDAIHQDLIETAVKEGQSLLIAGKSKTEASIAIYKMLEALDQQTIIQAFIKGANLTPMGAVTYWYNCRRKVQFERKQKP